MDKITLKLTSKEWIQLTGQVLAMSVDAERTQDKYMRSILHPLLKQVYVKLHNKMHSLRAKNSLNLTVPEAATLGIALMESDSMAALVIEVIGYIDQKLT